MKKELIKLIQLMEKDKKKNPLTMKSISKGQKNIGKNKLAINKLFKGKIK
jgi:hypothetical protein